MIDGTAAAEKGAGLREEAGLGFRGDEEGEVVEKTSAMVKWQIEAFLHAKGRADERQLNLSRPK